MEQIFCKMGKKPHGGLSSEKAKNFSEWYTEVIDKAEVVDIRYGVKGFIVIRPWGTMTMVNMYRLYEQALQKRGHKRGRGLRVGGGFITAGLVAGQQLPILRVFWLEKIQ